jgi:hypothetical protein
MPTIKNVKIDTAKTHEQAAYAARANYDTANATITLVDSVVIYQPLVVNDDYTADSKDIHDPARVKYTGTNPAGEPIFLVL